MPDIANIEPGRSGGDPSPHPDPAVSAVREHDDDPLGVRIAWRSAAVLYWVAGAAALTQLWSGFIGTPIKYPAITLAVGLFSIAAGCLWWVFGEVLHDRRWLHIGVITSYLVLISMFTNAPGVEAWLGMVYIVPLIFVALFLPSRSLGFYIGLSVALILQASLRHSGDEFGILPAVITIVALSSTAGLTLYVRLELDRIERQAAALSGRDPLTGLANLTPLYESVDRSLREADRGGDGVTVVMLDLEGFKQVNEEYSHTVGDETLRLVARALVDTVRRDELVARRGGDEFAVVTRATDPEDIETLVRRISHNVSDARIDFLPGVRSGVTFGVAVSRPGDSVGRLLARADHELNEAKSRTKITRWSRRQRRLEDVADELEDRE